MANTDKTEDEFPEGLDKEDTLGAVGDVLLSKNLSMEEKLITIFALTRLQVEAR